ncbi:hypothetical protein ACOZ38_00855 [Sphaerisporangium viridialbum]|uniref:hypothetical protein n=1 Tax=Sphaerisporangium viridialbum TaxID=46189 RepID=UPI003C77E7E4
MTMPYPITEEKSLGRTDRSGKWSLRRPRRAEGEVPRVKGDQVRVFLADGKYTVDHGRRQDDDDLVVRATYVAVVDMSRNHEVWIELAIPSADAKEFTVRVTFLCTVTDPVVVVRDGQGDAGRALLGYVRSHHRLFQLGLNHRVAEINMVRLNVQTQIEAYVQLKPPLIPGISAALASVEVLTPEELVALQKRLTVQEADHVVESGLADLTHELAALKARHAIEMEETERRLDVERKKHELKMDEMRLFFQRQQQVIRNDMTAASDDFATTQMAKIYQAIGDDPIKAAMIAGQKGELTSTDIAARVQEQRDRKAAEERELRDRSWALQDQDRQWNRASQEREYETGLSDRERRFLVEQEERNRRYALEDAQRAVERMEVERMYRIEDGDRDFQREILRERSDAEKAQLRRLWDLEDGEREMERERLQREYDTLQAGLKHQYELAAADREREHARQDRDYEHAVGRELRDREDRLHLLGVRLDMLKEIAKHGHLDEISLNPRELIGSIAVDTGAVGAVVGGGEVPPALTQAEEADDTSEGAVDDIPQATDESAFREEGLPG